MSPMKAFAHRRNSERSYESICLRCFRTAGAASREEMLIPLEARHKCRAEDLHRLRPQQDTSGKAVRRKGAA